MTIVFLPKGIVGSLRQMPLFARLRPPPCRIMPDPSALEFSYGAKKDGPVLMVQGLSRNFGGIRALSDVDLTIARDTVHGLIGPNGSGKSTFVNVVTGVFRPNAGTLIVDGESVPPQAPHRMARLGVTRTFQSIRLFGDMSVIDNIMVGFHLQLKCGFLAHLLQTGAAVDEEEAYRAKAMRILEFVGIAERAHEPALNLSHGQQRRDAEERRTATRLALQRPLRSLAEQCQLQLAHRALHTEQQSIIGVARIVDSVLVDDDGADQSTELD